jgi:hypothetical protein
MTLRHLPSPALVFRVWRVLLEAWVLLRCSELRRRRTLIIELEKSWKF